MMPETLITDSVPAMFGLLLFLEIAAAAYVLTNSPANHKTIRSFLLAGFLVTGIGAMIAFVCGSSGTGMSTVGFALLWLWFLNLLVAVFCEISYNHRYYDKVIEEEMSLR